MVPFVGQVVGDAAHGERPALDQDQARAVLLFAVAHLLEAPVLGIVVVPPGGTALLELAGTQERRSRRHRTYLPGKAHGLVGVRCWHHGQNLGQATTRNFLRLGLQSNWSCMLISWEPAVAVVSLEVVTS